MKQAEYNMEKALKLFKVVLISSFIVFISAIVFIFWVAYSIIKVIWKEIMKINWSRFKLPKIKSKTAELEEKIKDLEEKIAVHTTTVEDDFDRYAFWSNFFIYYSYTQCA